MSQTVDAVIDADGRVRLLNKVKLSGPRKARVTILDEAADQARSETALLSEAALAEDWNRPEEDEAWAHLQSVK